MIHNVLIHDAYKAICDECLIIKNSYSERNTVDDYEGENLIKLLNDFFGEVICTNILFTNNTDNVFFGIEVMPTITDETLLKIILTDEDVDLNRYSIEIDMNVFNILDSEEIAAYIVEEVSSIMSREAIMSTRAVLDMALASCNSCISIKSSVNYSQILTFGIKDTIKNTSSIIFRDNSTLGTGMCSAELDLHDTLVTIGNKIRNRIYGVEADTANPNLGILKWVLMIYDDIELNCALALDNLYTARQITGSELWKHEIDITLKCLHRIMSEIISESAILYEATKGFSLFRSLKQNGLRGLEDNLYEYKIRLKNCEDEEESLYLLRQINAGLAILEDYVMTTPDLDESEKKRWRSVAEEYRKLRSELGKKKFKKTATNFWVDYDALDRAFGPSY